MESQSTSKEYITSKDEMNRRKGAFTTLAITIFVSTSILSFDFLKFAPEIVVPAIIIFAVILVILRSFFNKLFENQSNLRIYISNNVLERKFKNTSEKYLTVNIRSIRIKRTVKGLIREIKIDISGAGNRYINGLDNFEQFKDDLLIAFGEDIPVRDYRESIDFDHPLYYVVFGSLVCILSSVLFRLILRMSESSIKYIQLSIACFLVATGIYWFFNKPVTGRYGDKGIIADYLLGLMIVSIGIYAVIYAGFF